MGRPIDRLLEHLDPLPELKTKRHIIRKLDVEGRR